MTVNRQNTINYLRTHDNLMIRYGGWPTESKRARGSIVLLNGRGEFLEKHSETIHELNQRQFDVYSFDWRGQGLSSRLLSDRLKGHVDRFGDYIRDVDRFLQTVVYPRAARPLTIVAHSMGGHIALRYLATPHGIARAVLLSPMIDIHTSPLPGSVARLVAGLAVSVGCQRAYVPLTARMHPAKIPFTGNRLTSDSSRFFDHVNAVNANPELAVGGVTWGWLHAAFASVRKLARRRLLADIRLPVLIVSAGADRIVSNAAQSRAANILPAGRLVRISGARHEILKERNPLRDQFWKAFDAFVSAP